jgi:hypothetical protein
MKSVVVVLVSGLFEEVHDEEIRTSGKSRLVDVLTRHFSNKHQIVFWNSPVETTEELEAVIYGLKPCVIVGSRYSTAGELVQLALGRHIDFYHLEHLLDDEWMLTLLRIEPTVILGVKIVLNALHPLLEGEEDEAAF